MVSQQKITEKFRQLDEYLDILKGLSALPLNDFLGDKIAIGAAKYYLQTSIECCLDIAGHVISAKRLRAPQDYADSFKVLEENRILDSALSQKLRQMAKFRNRLVHLYGEIDNAYIHAFISEDINDINSFKSAIAVRFFS